MWSEDEVIFNQTVRRTDTHQIRVQVSDDGQKLVIGMREWAMRDTGEWHPQKQAVHVAPASLPELIRALLAAHNHIKGL